MRTTEPFQVTFLGYLIGKPYHLVQCDVIMLSMAFVRTPYFVRKVLATLPNANRRLPTLPSSHA